jgi:hypothetical protein
MSGAARLSQDGRSVTVHVPMAFTKRGGRKLVISPNGASIASSPRARIDNTMIKALARAFRWRKLLETGMFGTVEEIAAAEKINASYVGRVSPAHPFVPDIVEAILNGRQPADMTLAILMRPFAAEWGKQIEDTRSRRLMKIESIAQDWSEPSFIRVS